MKKSPLDDLSFFKFPEVTPEVVRNIVLLFVVIALAVVATLFAQRFIYWRQQRSARFGGAPRRYGAGRLSPRQKALLDALLPGTGLKKRSRLLRDAEAFESAVAALAPQAGEAQLADLAELRQVFHLNVMSPALKLVSTRQLLPDFPLRLVTSFGDERLDLYCAMLERDERAFVLDLNFPREILAPLTRQSRCDLIFWREKEGETLFKIKLEPVDAAADMPVFRALHVMRAEEPWQRADFRLTVETPVRFTYLGKVALQRSGEKTGKEPGEPSGAVSGEGRLLDLSFGGASFAAERPLAPGGFVQLHFNIHGEPVRLMLEVLSSEPYGGRQSLVRTKLRGMPAEGRTLLNKFISREQIKRLRGREAFHVRPEG